MEYKYFDRIMALFVMVLIVSNIASSAKIIDLGFSTVTNAHVVLFGPVSLLWRLQQASSGSSKPFPGRLPGRNMQVTMPTLQYWEV